MLNPPTLTPAERDGRALALAERLVARYWRGWPCPSFGGRRLPKIAVRAYFDTGAEAVHWLDLDASLVREALGHELVTFERRLAQARNLEGVDMLLLDDVQDRLLADAVAGVRSLLVHRVRRS